MTDRKGGCLGWLKGPCLFIEKKAFFLRDTNNSPHLKVKNHSALYILYNFALMLRRKDVPRHLELDTGITRFYRTDLYVQHDSLFWVEIAPHSDANTKIRVLKDFSYHFLEC